MEYIRQLATLVHRLPAGEWPGVPTDLPMSMTELQLAHVLGRSLRTLQRKRYEGKGWIPHRKIGRSIYYLRDDVLAYYGIGTQVA
jgi:hypothetical protein